MKKYILILLSLILVSCGEGLIEEEVIETKIFRLSSNEYYLGDTIVIEGKDFGTSNSDVILSFRNSDSLELFIMPNDKNIIEWTQTKIKYLNDLKFNADFVIVGHNGLPYDSIEINNLTYPFVDYVEIPSGTFTQGSLNGFTDERIVRDVTISKNLLVARHELSQKLWTLVFDYNNSPRVNEKLPISNITWTEAILYCNELSKMYGLDTCYIQESGKYNFNTSADGWRLPTEAEWEYIANFSNIDQNQLSQFAWYNANSGYNAQFIGSKRMDFAGLYDLFGNVWEWCFDDYNPEYREGNQIDPIEPISNNRKVRRGGGYQSGELYCRVSNRTVPSASIISTGLRLVRNK
jgi:hypothetical protein